MTEISPLSALDVVSFFAGGHCFAVEAAQVRTQLPAVQYDEASSVEHILGLQGEKMQNPLSRRVLLMKCEAGDYAVTVSEPVELRSLEVSAIYPLPSLIAARSTIEGIRGLAIDSNGVTVLVDIFPRGLVATVRLRS